MMPASARLHGYLNAFAHVEDPTPGLRGLDTITTRKSPAAGRPVKAFNPVARSEYQFFVVLMSGEHAVHGFANRDLRESALVTFVRTRPSRVHRSADSATAFTSTDWSRRSHVRDAGASPRLAIGSWALRSDSANCTSLRSTPRQREGPREFHRKSKEPTKEDSMLRRQSAAR
jgi:hypothetical protein